MSARPETTGTEPAVRTGRDTRAEIAYPSRALKAPSLGEAAMRPAERARAENWTHEEYLAACLQRENTARSSSGAEIRIKTARFSARKVPGRLRLRPPTLPQTRDPRPPGHPGLHRGKGERCFPGPPGSGKTHPAIGLGIRACQAGHRVAFATAADWITRLTGADQAGTLPAELTELARYPLLIVDEVGYLPFDPDAANLFFQLVSSRYERASLIITSNMPFGRWGEVFNDDVVAAAMIDRLVHHAEVIPLKGASYRTRNRDLERATPATAAQHGDE